MNGNEREVNLMNLFTLEIITDSLHLLQLKYRCDKYNISIIITIIPACKINNYTRHKSM